MWVICMAVLGGCADKLLLFPSREPIDSAGKAVMVPTPGGAVQLWAIRSDGAPPLGGSIHHGVEIKSAPPEAYALGFIGNGSRAEIECENFVRYFSQHTVLLYVMNYPGFGGSEGSAKVAAIPPAALAAYDYVAAQARGKPIFVMGHSLGTAAALYVATQRPVAGLILHNPPPLHQLIMGRFGWWNGWIAASMVCRAVPDTLESIPNAKKVDVPAIFLLAGRDTLVTPPYQQMVVDAYHGPKKLIHLTDYGHNDPVEDNDLPRVWTDVAWM
ncbi:MAG TPA: alpha/beta fold hydrolase, partial [Tepidisphaeraceae bacterium]|nr:alpha/beta fold hydrolase [Tepidisphaeraceae bacterium]